MSTGRVGRVKRAGVYDRVSQDRRKGRSVAEQGEANRVACAEEDWQIIVEYEDNDRSASRHARKPRENWPLLLADLEAGRFDVLVLWESSRGDRELETWARMLSTCRRLGVLIHITNDERTYDVRRPRDWKDLAGAGVDSEYESEMTSQRIRRTTASQAAKGAPHGRVPYGYKRVYDPETGELVAQVIRDDQAERMREAARRVLAGETPHAIAEDFNTRGVPSPSPAGGPWWYGSVKRMLVNPIYIGKRTHHGNRHNAQWPPILDDLTHHQLIAKLTDPARKTARETAIRHLLSGLAKCGVCGGRTTVFTQGTTRKLAYTCAAKHCMSIHKKPAERTVERAVVKWLAQPDALALLTAGDDGDAVKAARTELAKLRSELEQLYAEREQGLSIAGLARLEAPLLAKIEDAERRARPRPVPAVLVDLARPDIAEVWPDVPFHAKREAIDLLVEIRVRRADPKAPRVFDPRRIRFRWKFGDELP